MDRTSGLVAAVALGMLLNPLNSSMAALALPRWAEAFHGTMAEASWTLLVFYLVSAVAQPVMGRLSDSWGRRRIFLGGLGVAALGFLAAMGAPSLGLLVAARGLQAVGTAMVIAVGLAIVRLEVVDGRARALGTVAATLSVAAAVGPSVAGFVLEVGDWPWLFALNLPLVALALGMAVRFLPADRPRPSPSFDLAGTGLFAVGLPLLFGGLSFPTQALGWVAAGAGAAVLGVFLWWEGRHPNPLVPVGLYLRTPGLGRVNGQFVLANTVFYGVFFGVPIYLRQVAHWPSWEVGAALLALGGGSWLGAPWAGWWADRSGFRRVLRVGGALGVVGTLAWGLWPAVPVLIVPSLVVLGLSGAFHTVGLQAALLEVSPAEQIGVTTGLFQTARYAGTLLATLSLNFGFGTLGTVLAVASVALAAISWFGRRPSTGSRTVS